MLVSGEIHCLCTNIADLYSEVKLLVVLSSPLDTRISGPGVGWSHWAAFRVPVPWGHPSGLSPLAEPCLAQACSVLHRSPHFAVGEVQIQHQRYRNTPGSFTTHVLLLQQQAGEGFPSFCLVLPALRLTSFWLWLSTLQDLFVGGFSTPLSISEIFNFLKQEGANQFVWCFRTPRRSEAPGLL